MQIKAVEIHDFGPGSDEVIDEFAAGVFAGIDFGNGSKLGVVTQNQIDPAGYPSGFATGAIFALIVA